MVSRLCYDHLADYLRDVQSRGGGIGESEVHGIVSSRFVLATPPRAEQQRHNIADYVTVGDVPAGADEAG